MPFLFVLCATALIAVLSVSGIVLLFSKTTSGPKWILTLVALSAGAMLGNALFHLLPEAFEMTESGPINVVMMMGLFALAFVISFLFEQVFSWHHCHTAAHEDGEHSTHCHLRKKPYTQLVLYSDGVHNFIDGVILAAFVVSPALGVATTLAIALHEIPQELGDFAVLVHGGYAKGRALLMNAMSASTVVVGGVIGYILSSSVELAVPILLPFAAGSFVYIAASDLLPELKHEETLKQSLLHFLIFLVGLAVMILTALAE